MPTDSPSPIPSHIAYAIRLRATFVHLAEGALSTGNIPMFKIFSVLATALDGPISEVIPDLQAATGSADPMTQQTTKN